MKRLLDLFSGAGGAGRGYAKAGFHVTGVDIKPQPRYGGHVFVQADALSYLTHHGHTYDYIHASPPCQHYAPVTRWRGDQEAHPDLLPVTQTLLEASGVPWIIENVPQAPLRQDILLCGSHFGLRVKRHRAFMLSHPFLCLLPSCQHRDTLMFMHKHERAYADAMGCHWMTAHEAREAIPPAYTTYIGHHLMTRYIQTSP